MHFSTIPVIPADFSRNELKSGGFSEIWPILGGFQQNPKKTKDLLLGAVNFLVLCILYYSIVAYDFLFLEYQLAVQTSISEEKRQFTVNVGQRASYVYLLD